MTVFARSFVFCTSVALLILGLMQTSLAEEESRVTGDGMGAFIVENGKVDPDTYGGYLTYTRNCQACHGPDGLGSSFAPNLIQVVERRGWENFAGTIAAGREIQPGQVMPSFADDPSVLSNIPKMFSYLRARGEGGLGRGRPKIIESLQEQSQESNGTSPE